MLQRLVNEVLALKKQISQTSFHTPYKDVPQRTYLSNASSYVARNKNKLPPPPKRLALEAPLDNVLVGYYETKQGDNTTEGLPLEDIVNSFQKEESELTSDSSIRFM